MLKLNPAHTMLWRSPTSVQFGADEPVAYLPLMNTAIERVITALSSGVSDVSLVAIARESGMTDGQLAELLAALTPALVGADNISPWRITIDGTGPTAETITMMLSASGHTIVTTRPDVVIVIGHHVLRPDQTGSWLRRDIAHLPVLFGDSLVRIGPLVTPGVGPCLHCVYLDHAEADASWHILATQLLGRKSRLETPRTCGEVAAMITRWIDNSAGPEMPSRLANRRHPREGLATGEVVLLEARSGRTTRVTYRQRAECACQALPQNVTPIANRRAGNLARTTKVTDAFSPA